MVDSELAGTVTTAGRVLPPRAGKRSVKLLALFLQVVQQPLGPHKLRSQDVQAQNQPVPGSSSGRLTTVLNSELLFIF